MRLPWVIMGGVAVTCHPFCKQSLLKKDQCSVLMDLSQGVLNSLGRDPRCSRRQLRVITAETLVSHMLPEARRPSGSIGPSPHQPDILTGVNQSVEDEEEAM